MFCQVNFESTLYSWKSYWKVETRLDAIAGEYDNHLYLFVVRPAETDTVISSCTPSIGQPFPIANSIGAASNATITISGISSLNYSVYGENRSGTTLAAGKITYSFTANAVYIYDITL